VSRRKKLRRICKGLLWTSSLSACLRGKNFGKQDPLEFKVSGN
jgi:hypothetical protein